MTTDTLQSVQRPARALANAGTHAKNLAGDALQVVARVIDQGRANCAAQVDSGRQAVVGYAREKPFTTIGIAALGGVVLGLLLFRR